MSEEQRWNLKKLREPFDPLEYEWKIQTCGLTKQGKPWAQIVPYIQSRALMTRLDEVVGAENWRAEYIPSPLGKGNECRLSIRVVGEWIEKRDGAEASDIEAVKGAYTNAFKRVCVVWGMGRELYEIEQVWADVSSDRMEGWKWASTPKKDKGGKPIDSKTFYWKPPDKWLTGGSPPEDADAEDARAMEQVLSDGTPLSPSAKPTKLHYQLTPAERDEAEHWLEMPDVDDYKVGPAKVSMGELLRFMLASGAGAKSKVEGALQACRERWDAPEEPPDEPGVVDGLTSDEIPF